MTDQYPNADDTARTARQYPTRRSLRERNPVRDLEDPSPVLRTSTGRRAVVKLPQTTQTNVTGVHTGQITAVTSTGIGAIDPAAASVGESQRPAAAGDAPVPLIPAETITGQAPLVEIPAVSQPPVPVATPNRVAPVHDLYVAEEPPWHSTGSQPILVMEPPVQPSPAPASFEEITGAIAPGEPVALAVTTMPTRAETKKRRRSGQRKQARKASMSKQRLYMTLFVIGGIILGLGISWLLRHNGISLMLVLVSPSLTTSRFAQVGLWVRTKIERYLNL